MDNPKGKVRLYSEMFSQDVFQIRLMTENFKKSPTEKSKTDTTVSPNKIIYVIHQNPALLKVWRELAEREKREVIAECEEAGENEIEKILNEIASRQRRLF